MATAKQTTANRRNAANSTGPRSQSGKQRASRNALKHGLSAERVVMFDEDPAVFGALRSDLFEHFQPADPVAEHLVEQVAACIWRLRRVPEIEARICTYFRHLHERNEAAKRVDSFLVQAFPDRAQIMNICNREAHEAAKEARERADVKLQEDEPLMGGMFAEAERSLSSLVRIAGAIESSMYRAIRELERIEADRKDSASDNPVIDVEAVEEDQPEPSKPRLIQS